MSETCAHMVKLFTTDCGIRVSVSIESSDHTLLNAAFKSTGMHSLLLPGILAKDDRQIGLPEPEPFEKKNEHHTSYACMAHNDLSNYATEAEVAKVSFLPGKCICRLCQTSPYHQDLLHPLW